MEKKKCYVETILFILQVSTTTSPLFKRASNVDSLLAGESSFLRSTVMTTRPIPPTVNVTPQTRIWFASNGQLVLSNATALHLVSFDRNTLEITTEAKIDLAGEDIADAMSFDDDLFILSRTPSGCQWARSVATLLPFLFHFIIMNGVLAGNGDGGLIYSTTSGRRRTRCMSIHYDTILSRLFLRSGRHSLCLSRLSR